MTYITFIILIISCYICYIFYNRKYIKYQCNIKNIEKRKNSNAWEYGNYIDLGSNHGDSVLWFYNKYLDGIKFTTPYPKVLINISKNFNTYIFEANPFLCPKIYRVVSYLKKSTGLVNFFIYCPVLVSINEGMEILTIDNNDVSSSKYYASNGDVNKIRKNITLPVINFTNFIIENIPSNNFNVMKFDVEGEEYYIIPELLKRNLLSKFDVFYSEFHTGNVNHPLKQESNNIFHQFLNYTESKGIPTYEEGKITNYHRQHHLDIYYELQKCRKNYFN